MRAGGYPVFGALLYSTQYVKRRRSVCAATRCRAIGDGFELLRLALFFAPFSANSLP